MAPWRKPRWAPRNRNSAEGRAAPRPMAADGRSPKFRLPFSAIGLKPRRLDVSVTIVAPENHGRIRARRAGLTALDEPVAAKGVVKGLLGGWARGRPFPAWRKLDRDPEGVALVVGMGHSQDRVVPHAVGGPFDQPGDVPRHLHSRLRLGRHRPEPR